MPTGVGGFTSSVGESSKSKVSLRFVGKDVEVKVEPSLPKSREASDGSLSNPKMIWLQNDMVD